MCRLIFYSIPVGHNMPLMRCFRTYRLKFCDLKVTVLKSSIICLILSLFLCSCGLIPVVWHSSEQIPAESIAYIRGGVFVSGEYLRSVTIAEIDNESVAQENNKLIKIGLGIHQVKIYCDEAKGEFNSLRVEGKAKTLELNAQLQRTYLAGCKPYSHWWIEDLDSKTVVAGEKFN